MFYIICFESMSPVRNGGVNVVRRKILLNCVILNQARVT